MDKKTFALLLVVFVDMVGFGIVIPILPLLVENISGGTLLVGVILSVFSLMQFIFSPVLGRLSDKYGRRPVLFLTSLINALSYFLIFLSQGIWVVFLARIIAGIGSANISVAQAYIADTSASHERTKKMALMGAAFGLGFIVGPIAGGVVSSNFGVGMAFLIPAVLSIVNTVLIFFVLPESNKNLQKHVKIQFFSLKVAPQGKKPKKKLVLFFLFFFFYIILNIFYF